MNAGLLIMRVVFGWLMASHGSQKLFGWVGGNGLTSTGEFIETLGFRPGRPFALADGLAQFVGGILLGVGLLEPVAAAMIMSVMIFAIVTIHFGKGLLATTNGVELPLLYLAAAFGLALTGSGAYSIDAVLEFDSAWTPLVTGVLLALGVVAALGVLAMRRTALAQA